ncbi:patatin-like phospholipase family protein [Pseudobacillus wudalianchiensis]|uniref:Patatin family protein n=1 Tax=Pseudobacillus wudalianchiensis TaxID=1743143 RepID=A0A1B9B9R1_9BACI|nr:patatin family protein [Bacillus wudalianchiensis]OCA92835.1 patatin family protein [Bacillus wudalianchiensis]
MHTKTGLVLEGGGMRGLYTAGVLDFFLENKIEFPYVIGVSAGACNAASYISKQWGRNKRVNIGFVRDPKYISLRNFFRNGELFGMDYVFDVIPNQIVPFDYEEFKRSDTEFVIGTTDCHTGEPIYFSRKEYKEDLLTPIRASSSLPFAAPIVSFQGYELLDGGMSDPIPVKKAEQDGCSRNVIVLTQHEGYMKKPSRLHFMIKRKYARYPGVVRMLEGRWRHYNRTIEYINQLEKEKKAFVIRPSQPLEVSRVERNQRKLTKLYDLGWQNAADTFEELTNWLNESTVTTK